MYLSSALCLDHLVSAPSNRETGTAMHYYTVSLPGNIPPSEVDDLVRGWRQSSAISFSFGGARLSAAPPHAALSKNQATRHCLILPFLRFLLMLFIDDLFLSVLLLQIEACSKFETFIG